MGTHVGGPSILTIFFASNCQRDGGAGKDGDDGGQDGAPTIVSQSVFKQVAIADFTVQVPHPGPGAGHPPHSSSTHSMHTISRSYRSAGDSWPGHPPER
jgi:hypothetical protein